MQDEWAYVIEHGGRKGCHSLDQVRAPFLMLPLPAGSPCHAAEASGSHAQRVAVSTQ